MPSESSRAEFIAARNAAFARNGRGWEGHDAQNPREPSGHACGISVSTRLTSYYRETHRKQAIDVTPRQVMDCLRSARVDGWVLMGLHGYVGYLPMPRATQEVDVMVPYEQHECASKAIQVSWPGLEVTTLPEVIRFSDPGDRDSAGDPKPVIDIMLPRSEFQQTILEKHVLIDAETGDRIPTIEAAIVSKYAAVLSPYRLREKEYDSGDLRQQIKANHSRIDESTLTELANQVWTGGGEDVLDFIRRAIDDEPFDI